VSKSNPEKPNNRSWREIPQQVNTRAMSRGGRQRMWRTAFRVTGGIITIALLISGIVVFSDVFQKNPQKLSAAVNAAEIDEIVLRSDGVLDQHWVKRTLALPEGVTLMELDIKALRAKLEAFEQIRSANVRRRFPSILEVSLAERAPVARINAQIGKATPRSYLVARDGVIFPGIGYDRDVRRTIPYLDGVKLVLRGDRFRPIKGMDVIGDLLATARNEAPHLYREWRVVSLARLADEGEIHVKATNVERIVFTTRSRDDFLRQIAQLDALIDSVRAHTDQPVSEINLAIGRMSDGRMQVPVTFTDPVPEQEAEPKRSPSLTPFLHPTRPTNREL
jgi:hypothetical protein